jgi:hypothetical protein
VSSPSKAIGYWNRPEVSQQDFHAVPTEYSESHTFLRTGDLGFLHQQELFICGRIKDLIIVRGSNHYPQDIERTAEQHNPLLRPGCSAAFSINYKVNEKENGETHEAVVFIAELREETTPTQQQQVIDTCLRVVSSDHGIALHAVVLLKSRTIPKTTSGKVARSWCRKAYLEQRLEVVKNFLNRDEIRQNEMIEKQEQAEGAEDEQLIPGNGTGAGGEEESKGNENVKKYQLVQGSDEHGPLGGEASSPEIEMKTHQSHSKEELRAMDLKEIECLLEEKLIHLIKNGQGGGGGGGGLSSPLSRQHNIASFGLDSMLITQYKGILENRFHCQFPDEFMFTKKATLAELAIVVKNGQLTEAQVQYLENIGDEEQTSGGGAGTGEKGTSEEEDEDHIVIDNPICPWFTCCY